MTKWWMIRAGDNNELLPVWEKEGIASIGWPSLGNPKEYRSVDDLKKKADEVFEEKNPRSRSSWVNQVWRFSHKIGQGDRVITYSKEKREYMIGTVSEDHFYDKTVGDFHYPNHIRVNWEDNRIARDILPQGAKNSLGSTLTVFRVDEWGETFEQLLNNPAASSQSDSDEETAEEDAIKDIMGIALGMIEDKIDHLDPWEMQKLIAGLLVAMGYYAEESGKGPDGGIDVLAYKDAFGFQKPIIKTQVKHRKDKAGSKEVQQLLGAHPMDANCLFISTGGFSSSALKVANQYSVKLINLEQLVKLIVEWYENMPHETKALLPLKKMYVPE
ncbi:restriction endonuclease [Salibacterium aidingense]|uniref:restriction endonuclease n=1 Tax=Salibacterium aidingense TaxID=384933 RepID=UPI00047D9837|nr:restriction endonuclease [Salibacterium aidingense]